MLYYISDVNDLQAMNADLAGDYILLGDIDASVTAGWNGGLGFEPIGTLGTPFTGTLDGRYHTITNLTINRPAENYIGLIGYNSGTVKNVTVSGVISGQNTTGAIIGANKGTVLRCRSEGSISGQDGVGGLVGLNDLGTIIDSCSVCNVSGRVYVGGCLSYNVGIVSNIYAAGAVNGTGPSVTIGGLIGANGSGGTISSSYYDTNTSGQSDTGKGTPKSTAEMMMEATFTGWDFTNVWDINEGASYPTLKFPVPWQETDNRIVGGIGQAFTQTAQRVTGYLLGRNFLETTRLTGILLTNHSQDLALLKGEITYRYQYLDEPDAAFLEHEDNQCSRPRKQLLIFHDSFPEQIVPGPGGRTRYIDITDRVTNYGEIVRDIPGKASDMPVVKASDLSIVLDNSDHYFTKRNPDSFLYGIDNYVGWREGISVELWTGYLVDINIIKAILVSKMVIIRISTESATGTATMDLRDYAAAMLDTVVGTNDPSALPPGPLEYPSKIFYIASGYIKMRHSNASAVYRNINIGTWAGLTLGKVARAAYMEAQMNKPIADGGLVTAAEESFSVTFNEETQLYTFRASGVDWIQFYADTPTATRFGFTLGQYYPSGPGAPPSGSTEIISPVSLATDTVNFTDLIEALLDLAGYDPADVDIQSLPTVNFMNVSFDDKTILQCVSEVAQCGSGILWMDRLGKVMFRRFENMDYTIQKTIDGDTNYQTAVLIEQDAQLKIRKIGIQGKFESIFAGVDSGVDVGSEYLISNNLVDTQALADDMLERIYNRYNISPAYLQVQGEFLPSLEIAKSVVVKIDGIDALFQGQITNSRLSVGDFLHRLEIQPAISTRSWWTRTHWQDYVAEDATQRLICPWDDSRLQLRLLEIAAGYRDYQFDCGPGSATARARWAGFDYRPEGADGVFFSDHFDVDPVGRYDQLSFEIQANGFPVPSPGPIQHHPLSEWGDAARINSKADDRITFMRLIGMLDTTPPHYLNYELRADFVIPEIHNYQESVEWTNQNEQARRHYFGMIIRQANMLHCNWALIRAEGGLASPQVGYLQGTTNYLYTPRSRTGEYCAIGEVAIARLGVEGNQMYFAVDATTPRYDVVTPVFDPWNFPGQVAVGFSRCLGYVRRFELSSYYAPAAPDPTFQFRTSNDASSWTAWSSTFPVGVISKYIQIRVTMSRPDIYTTLPKLAEMHLGHAITAL